MGDVVPTSLLEDREFIVDCCRFSEGLVTEAQIKKKYRFDAATWERLGADDALVEAIELEKTRRIRNGTTARERAQVLYAGAPTVLGNILNDGAASPRHRIESAKALGQIAAGPEATAPAPAERFIIQIVMGSEAVIYDHPKTIDSKPTTEDAADQLGAELIPFVASRKRNEGNGGDFL